MAYKFKQQIVEILGDAVENYSEQKAKGRVTFDYPSNTITFDRLAALSRLLGTQQINFTGSTHEYQYGTGTWDSDNSGEIEATEVQF